MVARGAEGSVDHILCCCRRVQLLRSRGFGRAKAAVEYNWRMCVGECHKNYEVRQKFRSRVWAQAHLL